MSKKNTIANTIKPAITTTINEQEENNMKNTVQTIKNIPATTAPMSAQEFKQKSYDAYLAYVSFIEGEKSSADTVEALFPLMNAYGFDLTIDNLANLLTVKMTAYGKDKGEQAKKVKSIATFRAFVKGGWQEVAAAPVHANAGKNPSDAKAPAKAKQPTKAELAAQIAALQAQLAAAKASNTTPAAEEAAA